jgi:hypothetical protein
MARIILEWHATAQGIFYMGHLFVVQGPNAANADALTQLPV